MRRMYMMCAVLSSLCTSDSKEIKVPSDESGAPGRWAGRLRRLGPTELSSCRGTATIYPGHAYHERPHPTTPRLYSPPGVRGLYAIHIRQSSGGPVPLEHSSDCASPGPPPWSLRPLMARRLPRTASSAMAVVDSCPFGDPSGSEAGLPAFCSERLPARHCGT